MAFSGDRWTQHAGYPFGVAVIRAGILIQEMDGVPAADGILHRRAWLSPTRPPPRAPPPPRPLSRVLLPRLDKSSGCLNSRPP